ncbi:hypothetical protein JGH11_15345 [Dysgonomonas sp. Marseille-P4677]|uniref:hypothetical protein n=1 Tax=Dysgonomonas sp. Marseille-P4677 TaxID=2364790 RepID=UPI001911BD22|nr:hypothetical protein [Dysgonomonas sp. Marseille-P4677]MBK5722250.1 hypothetical protein [Dysgonomonas sp. Marseille-P4677]
MVKLRLPRTIRLARMDEVPDQKDIQELVRQSADNNIVEGYKLSFNLDKKHPFNFFAEINIDNNRLWSLFKSMMMAMSEPQSLLTAFRGDSLASAGYSTYHDKYSLYNGLSKYEKELTCDVFIKFGVIHEEQNTRELILVASSKYIQYWGRDISYFRGLMDSYSLYEIPHLEFIDNYPMITTSLDLYEPDVLTTADLIKQLRIIFM